MWTPVRAWTWARPPTRMRMSALASLGAAASPAVTSAASTGRRWVTSGSFCGLVDVHRTHEQLSRFTAPVGPRAVSGLVGGTPFVLAGLRTACDLGGAAVWTVIHDPARRRRNNATARGVSPLRSLRAPSCVTAASREREALGIPTDA